MKYVSMLRGINVAGQKKIKMSCLKKLYESLGLQNVETYIQSGNVIFDYAVNKKSELKKKIEESIYKKYQFDVLVQIRTNHELGEILRDCPFGSINLVDDGTKVLVTFLCSKPSEADISGVQKYVAAQEKLVVIDKEVYLYCPNGYGKSKLSNQFLENKLKVKATTRNWKTIHKLYELSM